MVTCDNGVEYDWDNVTLTRGVREVIGIVSKDSEEIVCTEVGFIVLLLPLALELLPVVFMKVVDEVKRSASDDGKPEVDGYVDDMAEKSGKKAGLFVLEVISSLLRKLEFNGSATSGSLFGDNLQQLPK